MPPDLTGRVVLATADVTDRAALIAAVDALERQLGRIGVLINNAGVSGPIGPMWNVDAVAWWHTLEVNLGGAVTVSSIVPPGMIAAGGGRIDPPDRDTDEGRVLGWLRDPLEYGHGADPHQAAHLILRLAAGRGDRQSGRHLTVGDELDTLLDRIEQIEAADLHTLRLRTAAA